MGIDWNRGKPEEDGKYLTACLEPEDKDSLILDLAYFQNGDWEIEQDRDGGDYAVIYWAHINMPPVPKVTVKTTVELDFNE